MDITIKRYRPEVGTDDMLARFIAVEFSKAKTSGIKGYEAHIEGVLNQQSELNLTPDYAPGAFLAIAKELLKIDRGLNSGIKYIAIDTANVPLESASQFAQEAGDWVESLGCELLISSYDSLVQEGYIVPINSSGSENKGQGFKDGILIRFHEARMSVKSESDGTALIKAEKYRSPLGATGAEFKLELVNGGWVVGELLNPYMA
jgi:hypothetical protein